MGWIGDGGARVRNWIFFIFVVKRDWIGFGYGSVLMGRVGPCGYLVNSHLDHLVNGTELVIRELVNANQNGLSVAHQKEEDILMNT